VQDARDLDADRARDPRGGGAREVGQAEGGDDPEEAGDGGDEGGDGRAGDAGDVYRESDEALEGGTDQGRECSSALGSKFI
jgi:hypothetical protein